MVSWPSVTVAQAAGAPAGNNMVLSGPAAGGVGAIGGNNLDCHVVLQVELVTEKLEMLGGASACFDIQHV